MAVYKATYCYPFLNTVDSRVTLSSAFRSTAQYLKCKVDTSNINITGYKIRILDTDNNVVFPIDEEQHKISPIQELYSIVDENSGINTGVNGTTLQIPFFQNYNYPILRDTIDTDILRYNNQIRSYNAIYYKANFEVTYLLDMSLQENKDWIWLDETQFKDAGWIINPDISEEIEGHIIDGQMVMEGQLVLVTNSVDHNGIFKAVLEKETSDDGTVKIYIKLIDYADEIIDLFNNVHGSSNYNGIVTVMQGFEHSNENYYISFTVTTETIECQEVTPYTGDMWVNYDNKPVVGYNINGSTYKWEITLYQGDAVLNKAGTESYIDSLIDGKANILQTIYQDMFSKNSSIYNIVYTKLDNNFYDMRLTTGTVLGSTPERIQLSDLDEESIPSGVEDSTLILQGKWMRIANASNRIEKIGAGNDIYVQSYDTTYGHVYPKKNSLEASIINTADTQYVQFFKYCANEEYILDQDKVEYAQRSNATLRYADISNKIIEIGDSEEFWEINDVPVDSRRLLISETLGEKVGDGKRLLLWGQNKAKENGIWLVEKYVAAEEEGEEEKPFYCLLRVDEWSSYIGKVIYAKNGDSYSARQNIESLANAGNGSVLWDPNKFFASTSDTPLYFNIESPILLFGEKLRFSVNLCDNSAVSGAETWIKTYENGTIDGIIPVVGDYVLFLGMVGLIESIDTSTDSNRIVVHYKKNFVVEPTQYIYVNSGKIRGHKVYKNGIEDWSLYTGKILKNTKDHVYVSPFISLDKEMKLKLTGGQKVVFESDNEPTEWISIKKVNTVLWRIELESTLTEPMKSFDISNKDVPYKYEICSYFKKSDENVFYSYQSPYIEIEVNHMKFGNFSEVIGYSPFIVEDVGETTEGETIYDQYWVKSLEDTGRIDKYYPLFVRTYTVVTELIGRSVNISGKYIQANGGSWESYRWVLLDDNGRIIQDTGKKYNRSMETNFYGLANDTPDINFYYAVLYVEDGLGNTLQYVIKLKIASTNERDGTHPLLIPFEAKFDCATQSVILTYEDNGFLKPSYNIGLSETGEEVAFDPDNADSPLLGWDNSLDYLQGSYEAGLDIIGVNGQFPIRNNSNIEDGRPAYNAPVYGVIDEYGNGRPAYSSDGELRWETYTISKPVDLGLTYSSYFGRDYSTISGQGWQHKSTKDQILTLGEDVLSWDYSKENPAINNELYFETSVMLDNNYCGKFLSIDVEGKVADGNQNPVNDATGEREHSFNGYLTLQMFIPEDIESSEERFKIGVVLKKDRHSDNEQETNEEFFSILYGEDGSNYYYMQLTNEVENKISKGMNFCHYNLNNEENHKDVWFSFRKGKNDDDNKYLTSSDKFLGNACTVSPGDDYSYVVDADHPIEKPGDNDRLNNGPVFWAEDRNHLIAVKNIDKDGNISDTTEEGVIILDGESKGLHLSTRDLVKWPGTAENESYWLENGEDVEEINWNDISENTNSIVSYQGVERHPDCLENEPFNITCLIKDIEGIYDNFSSVFLNNESIDSCGEIKISAPINGQIEESVIYIHIGTLLKEGR